MPLQNYGTRRKKKGCWSPERVWVRCEICASVGNHSQGDFSPDRRSPGERVSFLLCCRDSPKTPTLMAQTREEYNRRKAAKRAENREAFLQQTRAYRAANRERINAARKQKRLENYEAWRADYERYRSENLESIKEKGRKWREQNAEKLKKRKRDYHEKNREQCLAKSRAYREANPEKVAQRKRKCYLAKRDEVLEKHKIYRQNNRDACLARTKAYRDNLDPEIRKKRARDYTRKRRHADPLYALKSLCRCRIGHALRGGGWTKAGNSKKLLGCTYEELRQHLESHFLPGMTWENRGLKGWHVDHIQPLALAETEEDVIRLLHFSNLQPIWEKDNLKKASKLPCGKLVRKNPGRKIP
jgi:hypothetical protein